MKIIGFIPARFASTRFQGKALALIAGKPMIHWVYENAKRSKSLNKVVVLTDDKRIVEAVQKIGGNVIYTSKKCKSGTERIVSALKKYPCDIAVNIQGDEPLLQAADIDMLIKSLVRDKYADIATLACVAEKKEVGDPNVVKVVVDHDDYSLYFSRSVIPFARHSKNKINYLHHIGIYAYRSNVLKKVFKLKMSFLECAEKLEQLRFLENGYRIRVAYTKTRLVGVDTLSDAKKVEKILKSKRSKL